jgi:hypothetical protein
VTAYVDIVNRALQIPGTRTTVTAAELLAGSSNEAIQANLLIDPIRRQLIRMAPWNFALRTANLVYITSSPGTPENTSAPTTLWAPGQPPPPWNYEYQYPVDCLRACFLIPATQTGFAGGIPITTAVTGGAASFWQGPPVKFKIQNDQFYTVNTATVANGGSGYAQGDLITLAVGPNTAQPIGAPAILQVLSAAGGVITGVGVVNAINGESPPLAGSYFAPQSNPVAQGSTTGLGTGATFNLTFTGPGPQRVVVTNQEFATLTYCQDVSDPNVMDDEFQEAWVKILGASLCIPLTGDKRLANMRIQEANVMIAQARVGDANEALSVNDVTPDWIRARGISFSEPYSGPFSGLDWGGMWPIFG